VASYTDLVAWKACHRLALAVVAATNAFPRHERFELTSQLRRAALSAPTNLVEGHVRFGPREFLRFVRIAAGSLAEVDYLLLFARENDYLTADRYESLVGLRREAS
jgi:four helix bundle protein